MGEPGRKENSTGQLSGPRRHDAATVLRASLILVALIAATAGFCQDRSEFGHSHLGSAFDTGLRTKPWKFKGLGKAPFPISAKSAELQSWYDQGNELLHSFWFEEAERSFRWCLKLERENAMVYFGLARCGLNWFSIASGKAPELNRFRDFLKEAVKRKETVTERERLYIEAWDAAWAKDGEEARKEIIVRLQKLCLLYPKDIEAKCQLAFYNIGQGSALTNHLLIQEVLSANPMHPGAHHACIHNWDDVDGGQAIASCELYGKAAPGVGHALHMPGHIYAGIGMWHEAAIAMDSATRVELRHMNERLALPFENWNYPHNRDYLCYIQEQLGRAEESIRGIKDIINSPRDPVVLASQYPAVLPLLRALLKFEMWDRILEDKDLAAVGPDFEPMVEAARVIAYLGLGRTAEAKSAFEANRSGLQRMIQELTAKNPEQADEIRKDMEQNQPFVFRVAEAKMLLAEGKGKEALAILSDLEAKEDAARAARSYSNDPPFEAWPAARLVGDAHFASGDFEKAAASYEKALAHVKNDAWSLAGLAKSHAALGNSSQASNYASRLLAVWSGADSNLKLVNEVHALNLKAKPKPVTFKPEREYRPESLNHFGPSNWEPFAAPELDCRDSNGRRVRLSDLKGKNVLLVFYLSDQCVHCMDQLAEINKRIKEFSDLNTKAFAVSSATPSANRESTKLAPFSIGLLSDVNHTNARRFASYDDMEDMELHSTILIDAQGRVRWKRTGGDPFADVEFLLREIKRWAR